MIPLQMTNNNMTSRRPGYNNKMIFGFNPARRHYLSKYLGGITNPAKIKRNNNMIFFIGGRRNVYFIRVYTDRDAKI